MTVLEKIAVFNQTELDLAKSIATDQQEDIGNYDRRVNDQWQELLTVKPDSFEDTVALAAFFVGFLSKLGDGSQIHAQAVARILELLQIVQQQNRFVVTQPVETPVDGTIAVTTKH